MKPPLGNISNDTTVAQVGRLAAQYGVTQVMLSYDLTGPRGPTCSVVLVSDERTTVGTSCGKTKMSIEAEALDDAFARLKHVIGARITAEGAASGASTKWAL